MSQEFNDEELKVLEKVEKLLRLAAKNSSPEEAASANAKAQELLVAYNLSVDSVGKTGATGEAKREQQVIRGGMYQYQRDLWRQIAKLNFCLYWTIEHKFDRTIRRRHWSGEMRNVIVDGKEFRHTVIGKRLNVKSTMMMADYLQSTIERLVKERYPDNSQRFMSEAIAYREGMVYELEWRLAEKRKMLIDEEERRMRAEFERKGVSTSQALTIGSLSQQEDDANQDFIHGEGYSARLRAERAARAEAYRKAEEEYTKWAAENPEEARKEQKAAEERRKQANKGRRYSGGQGSRGGQSPADRRMGTSAFRQGQDEGRKIGLDVQASAAPTPKALK